MFLIAFLIFSGILIFDFLYKPISPIYLKTEVIIRPGSTPGTIGKILKEKGLIKSQALFVYYTKISGMDKALHAGAFNLSPSYSMSRISEILALESGVVLIRVTIPEGFNLTEIANVLDEKGVIPRNEFLDYAHHKARYFFRDKYTFLAELPTGNVEGYLFPDTYIFAKGNTPEVIFNTFFKRFNEKIMPIWQSTPKILPLNLHKTLTLASVIEKEAYVTDEMPIISSVYAKRLMKKMPMAACPTVLYAIGDENKHSLYFKDLKVNSLYNTYLKEGLPPTPIASPGEKAFRAAIRPAKTPYYYFVAKGDGSHYFSRTLAEHNANTRKYQQFLRSKK
jgi:UPF0755 protein